MTMTTRLMIALSVLITLGITCQSIAFAYVLDATEASAPSDAGVIEATPAVVSTTLPDPGDQPKESASLVYKLYKAGHLVPALIVAAFFVLALLQRRVAWLRTGYRKVAVAALLGGLGMLAERVASGTTPNLMMLMGALGAAFTMWLKTEGAPKSEA
jgi:hypothetical protein